MHIAELIRHRRWMAPAGTHVREGTGVLICAGSIPVRLQGANSEETENQSATPSQAPDYGHFAVGRMVLPDGCCAVLEVP